jgi:integrase
MASAIAVNRKRGKPRQAGRRAKGRLKVGVDVPTLDKARAYLKGRWRPLILPQCSARRGRLSEAG